MMCSEGISYAGKLKGAMLVDVTHKMETGKIDGTYLAHTPNGTFRV